MIILFKFTNHLNFEILLLSFHNLSCLILRLFMEALILADDSSLTQGANGKAYARSHKRIRNRIINVPALDLMIQRQLGPGIYATRLAFCNKSLDETLKMQWTRLGYITSVSSIKRRDKSISNSESVQKHGPFKATLQDVLAKTASSANPKICLLLGGNVCPLIKDLSTLHFAEKLLVNGWIVHQYTWSYGWNPIYLHLQRIYPNFKLTFLDCHRSFLVRRNTILVRKLADNKLDPKTQTSAEDSTTFVKQRGAWLTCVPASTQVLIGFCNPLFQLIL